MSSSASSNSTQTITNVVFGLTATTISGATVWQGHRVWKMWREHNGDEGNVAADLELGLQPVHSTPTSLETLEHEEVVDSSALPTGTTRAVAASEHMSLPTQSTEAQSTPSTTIETETSLGASSAQGAQAENNNLPNVDNENAQPATPHLEHGEPLPAANDNHDPAGVH